MFKRLTIFLRLVKFPISLMVAFSALTGYSLAGNYNLSGIIILLSGVFLLAGGSSILNQVQERNFDLLMERTKNRPLPSGKVSVFIALAISLLLLFLGGFFLGLSGWWPLMLGLFNVILYNFIYTPLKRQTWLAIVPGSLVGAVPPIIGWTSGGLSIASPLILFVSLFVALWQVPHFWLIFIKYRGDYKNAGFASLPSSFEGNRITKVIFFWALFTSAFLCSFPLFGFRFSTSLTGVLLFLNLIFITLFYRFLFGKEANRSVSKAFILINSFAVAILCLMIFGNH